MELEVQEVAAETAEEQDHFENSLARVTGQFKVAHADWKARHALTQKGLDNLEAMAENGMNGERLGALREHYKAELLDQIREMAQLFTDGLSIVSAKMQSERVSK